jgi:hypothetical protein
MLGLSRVETEDFWGQHHVPLSAIGEADLDREAALYEVVSRRHPIAVSKHTSRGLSFLCICGCPAG